MKLLLLWIGSILYHNHKSKVVFYHDVFSDKSYKSLDTDILLGTPIETFKEHISTIKKEGFEIVPYITEAERQVSIMFDDGFRGIWDNRDFFRENQIRPTVFLAVDLIGKDGFLTKDEILELQNQYDFIFQCHGWSHTDLSKCNEIELEKELCESRNYLSKLIGHEVNSICLPKGFFSDCLLSSTKLKEYTHIYSSVPGNYDEKVFGMIRRNLCQFATKREVALIINGGNEMIKNRYLKLHHKQNSVD